MAISILRNVVALGVLAISPPLLATDSAPPLNALPNAAQYSTTMLPEREGVVSWKSFASVEQVTEGTQVVPRFSKEILNLDKRAVRIQGFILALEMGEQQKHFLVSAVPPHCPFCMPAGPDAIVEVFAKKPVRYSVDPIVVSGKLALLKNDPSGVLYRLIEAEPVDK
jgi:hypothetical protein